jgi:hypothetical protein
MAQQNIKRLHQEITDLKRRHERCVGEKIETAEQAKECEPTAVLLPRTTFQEDA